MSDFKGRRFPTDEIEEAKTQNSQIANLITAYKVPHQNKKSRTKTI